MCKKQVGFVSVWERAAAESIHTYVTLTEHGAEISKFALAVYVGCLF